MYPHFELANLVMIYLLGVAATGLWFGRGPSVLSAVLNVAAFDFFFVPPQFTFAVTDVRIRRHVRGDAHHRAWYRDSHGSVRQQTRVAGARERRTALLYAMSRELAAARGASQMATIAIKHVAEVFDCDAIVLLPEPRESSTRHPTSQDPRVYREKRRGGGSVGSRSRPARGTRDRHAAGDARNLSSAG